MILEGLPRRGSCVQLDCLFCGNHGLIFSILASKTGECWCEEHTLHDISAQDLNTRLIREVLNFESDSMLVGCSRELTPRLSLKILWITLACEAMRFTMHRLTF